MATNTETTKYVLTAEDRSKAAFASLKGNLREVETFAKTAVRSFAIFAGISGVGALAKSAIDSADRVQKLTIRLGDSTEALSQYRHVAELSGVEFETLAKAFQVLAKNTSLAVNGLGPAKDALGELGIEADRLNKLKPSEQFEVIADALHGLSSETDRVRLATQLFGDEGASVLQVMADGSEGIRKMRGEADKLGLTLTRTQANAMADFNDQVTRIKNVTFGLAQTVVTQLGPAFVELVDWVGGKIPSAMLSGRKAVALTKEAYYELSAVIYDLLAKRDEIEAKIFGVFSSSAAKSSLDSMNSYIAAAKEAREKAEEQFQAVQKIQDEQDGKASNKFSVSSGPGFKEIFNEELKNKTLARIREKKAKSEETDQQKELAKLQDYLSKQVDTIDASFDSEESRLESAYEKRKLIVEESFQREIISRKRRDDLMATLENNYYAESQSRTLQAQAERERLESETQGRLLNSSGSFFGSLIQLSQGHSKRLFAIAKAGAIATAVMSTHKAAAEALSFPPGPPLSYAYVAEAILLGFQQVASIKNTAFQGQFHDGTMNVPRTGSYVLEGGEAVLDRGTAGLLRDGSLGGNNLNQSFVINISGGGGMDMQQLAAKLIPIVRSTAASAVRSEYRERGRRSPF